MKKTKSDKIKPVAQRYTLTNAVLNYYLLVMFTLFPLYVKVYTDGVFPFVHFDDGFIGIRHEKYYLFLALTVIAVIAEILLLVTRSMYKPPKDELKEQQAAWNKVSFVDWAALGLLLTCAISTLFSAYPQMAFWGEENGNGRNNGLLLILCYILAYFMITRCYEYKEFVFTGLALSCAAVYLLTVLNGYYLDPLNMFEQFREQENIYMEFFSTIGNKNMLASFICVTLPVIFTMSVHTQRLANRIIYLCSAGLGAMALIIGDSDSGILGVGVFLAVYLIIYMRNTKRLKKFFLGITVMLLSVKLLRLFSLLMNDNYKKLGDITRAILLSNAVYILLAASAIITVLLYWLDKKKPGYQLPKALPIAFAAIYAAVLLGAAAAMIHFSVFDTETELDGLAKLFRMNDAWGTHRGIMWLKGLDAFGEMSFFNKLFGTGPDTFYYVFQPYFSQLLEYGNSSTDAAHNEYINYLCTIGIVGLAAYLSFTCGALVRAFQTAKKNPIALVFASAVLAYLVQAVVNIALPIATPVFIILVSLCEATARKH